MNLSDKRSTHQINRTTLFTRVSIPDEIVVINYISNQGDITPPDRIKNFRVIQVAGKSKYLLTWTATGDDRDQGQAQRYDIRNSDNIDTIRYNFNAALPVENITMSPLPSGEEELIALHGITDDENQEETSFLAIRAIDESGNAGDVSNIISLVRARSFSVIENNITEELISSTQESLPFPTNRRDEVNNTAIMLSSIVAGMCVLLAVIVSILLVKTFKKKAKVGHGFPADSMNKLGPSKMYFNLERILEEQKTPPEAWNTDFLSPPYHK
ncbi:hypothetical protein CHS0354_031693 [Potamilus streckersoni]|uniref:Uncharacterized protein n=1 Tax=Potamilus streckersoni TaxID=2493646 RepID=A0AAE0SSF9_9BIVA|nr:hypothetical protein CHS0354_031693 [Potamilus streckersoni]